MSEPLGTLPVMKVSDMVPREEFKAGDRVRCEGGMHGTGIILKVDADNRLALVEWRQRVGWWYLKDLEKVFVMRIPQRERSEVVFAGKDPGE